MVSMINVGKHCVYMNHERREKYVMGGEKVEICHDCMENVVEGLKIDAGWYAPYGY